jgi:tetratricopeptide (TPR) repeat protein
MFARIFIPQRRESLFRNCRLSALALACMFFGTPSGVVAQTGQTSLEVYANAMKQPQLSQQITELEKFLSMADNGVLKHDGLEVLIWDYIRMGSTGQAQQHAAGLLKMDPGNPVAIAAMPAERYPQRSNDRRAARDQIQSDQNALSTMESLRKPEGMLPGDFAALRRHVESSLNGALGLAYVDRGLYQQALTPLQQAAAVDPANPQYAYGLGLALLYSKDPNQQNAFLFLARAANMTQGTAAGQQIADFARKEYHKAGGKDAEWNQYLAAATVPERQRTEAVVARNSTPPPATSPAQPVSPSAAAPAVVAHNSVPSTPNATVNKPLTKRQEARVLPPDLPSSSVPRPSPQPTEKVENPVNNGVRSPYAPVSLGILIETALLTKQNRPVILAALKDVVGHLRGEDEAAILVFSDQLDFEQDLTANDELLEQAINSLRPRRGRALLDGVAFAAGHLKRIGKNPTRVLLVISDGKSQNMDRDALPLSTQVSGVRVDCIGLHADGSDQRELLQRLAAYSGGQARFADGADQFRMLSMEMTGFLGVRTR